MYTPVDFEEKHVVGIRLHGNVNTSSFIEAMQKVISKMESPGHFNLYVEVEPEEGMDTQLFWESLKFGFSEGREYIERLDKLVLVTDKSWLRSLGNLEDKLVSSIDQKTFSFEDKDKAVQWISQPGSS